MPEYLSPGVYIEEIEGPQPIQAVGTSTGAFVGLAQSGPVNSAQLITNYTQFGNTFGGYIPNAFLAYAVQNFFNEGGTRCYVVRAFKNKSAPTLATPYPDVATVNVTSTGDSTGQTLITICALDPGSWGNALSVQILADTFDANNTPTATLNAAGSGYQKNDVLTLVQYAPTVTLNASGKGYKAADVLTLIQYVPTVTLDAGGTGYKANDVLTLVQAGGSGATLTVNSVSAAGAVTQFTLTTPGTGYTTANGLAVTGGAGTGATFNLNAGGSGLTITVNSVSPTGAVVQYTLTTPGTGYTTATALSVTGGSGTNATFDLNVGGSSGTVTVNSVSTTGAIVQSTLTAPGTGYNTGKALTVTGGSGSGATFDYNANPNQQFQLQVFETPTGSTLPVLVETYAHVSLVESDSNGIPNPNHVEQRVNGVSKYITAIDPSPEPSSTAPPPLQTATLTGGTDGLPPGPTSDPTAMHATDLIGQVAQGLNPGTGLFSFDPVDDINIVAIPDLQQFDGLQARDATLSAITYCQNRGDCFYVADTPSGLLPQQALDYKQGQNTFSGNAFNSKYAAIYYPWIQITDPLTGGLKLAPPSGAMVGRYSATDVARGVFKAPAGTVDGYVNSAMDIERITTQGEQDLLNPAGVNVIRKFADAGIVIWGARTVSSDSEWTYVPVRRLVIEIEQSILLGTQGVVFEPNDPSLWKRIIRDVGAFLRLQWMGGALFGDKAEQAYFVKCDSETNPPESIAVGRVVTVVGIAPVKPAEFVIFQIQLTSGGGSVSE
ncbi:MAG: phage tail sheath subtilisin-like domain-containing protein [Candidatus Korobacteraceae bacterium]